MILINISQYPYSAKNSNGVYGISELYYKKGFVYVCIGCSNLTPQLEIFNDSSKMFNREDSILFLNQPLILKGMAGTSVRNNFNTLYTLLCDVDHVGFKVSSKPRNILRDL